MQRRLVATGIALLCAAVQGAELRTSLRQGGFRAETQLLAIECSRDLRLRVFSRQNGSWTTLSPEAGMPAALSVDSGAGLVQFTLSGSASVRRGVKTAFGAADRISATGGDAGNRIGLALTFDFPRGYPDVVVIQTGLTGLERGKSTLIGEIRQAALQLQAPARASGKPGFRVELCPCGITPTFQLVMTMDQPTDSDPYDEQVTSRTKFLKAMFGPRCPVLQEYVGLPGARSGRGKRIELYPRALGTGQVISTFARTLNESHARWTAVYNRHRPSEGEYLNLYDLRWEPVEGHVIRKAQKFYYGFFTGKPGGAYSGSLELRGLDKQRRYRITDYANDRDLGAVTGPRASITATFEDALLLVAEPLER